MARPPGIWHPPQADWLIDPAAFPARATVSSDGQEAVLENGLIRRTIRLVPGAATVAFDDLMGGNALIRSVRPEAALVINGRRWDVGGLDGQATHNWIDSGEIGRLACNPAAFRCLGTSIGVTAARFPWRPHREWMAQDLPWPPTGRALTLHFSSPAGVGAPSTEPVEILRDDSPSLSTGWKAELSERHPRTSVLNEGKPGEILARTNNHACLERPWPAGATTVACLVDPGTDGGDDMAPGLAIEFPHGRLKINLRPRTGRFGVFYCESLRECADAAPGRPYVLRVRLVGRQAICEASADARDWIVLDTMPCDAAPVLVRIGKTSRGGRAASPCSSGNPEADGELVRCRIGSVVFQGTAPEAVGQGAAPGSVTVDVHYEIYDGIPLLCKWLEVRNLGDRSLHIDAFTSEILAVAEAESLVESPAAGQGWEVKHLHVETDYAFHGMSAKSSQAAVHWLADRTYQTQVNYNLETPCLLECRPPLGPAVDLEPGGTFTSFRTFELVQDVGDRERRGLALRRMYRAIAPWTAENPLMMHVTDATPEAVRLAIDQCAEAGFELLILSFLSGFDWESRDPAYQETIRGLVDHARAKGVALGGYSLLASRSATPATDNCSGGVPTYGVMPCLGSTWGRAYLEQVQRFAEATGLMALEHDGSYPGDTCAATGHPHHRGLEDSQWVQWQAITGLYQWCRARGIFLNVPDWFFLAGASKTGMGYRETNWSLPRQAQEIIERQNIFDGTWEKTASMGWMFVPLTEYHGGGAVATIDPMEVNYDHYRRRLANLFGSGTMALFRGRRLYDGERSRALVREWVDFYRAHRAILDSDIIHLRRADGCDIDGFLHVNPGIPERGLLMIYNPLDIAVERCLRIPLYYAGLTRMATVVGGDGTRRELPLDRDYGIELPVIVPARGSIWFSISDSVPR